MQEVHCTDSGFGSFSWGLSRDLDELIGLLPQYAQTEIQEILAVHLKQHLLMLAGSLQMGLSTAEAFTLIYSNKAKLLVELRDMVEEVKGESQENQKAETPRLH